MVVDSEGVEKHFAESLEEETDVAVYTNCRVVSISIRQWDIITQTGAIAFNEGTVKHIYFIAETKGNEWATRRNSVVLKMLNLNVPPRHFEAISTSGNVVYGVAKDYKNII